MPLLLKKPFCKELLDQIITIGRKKAEIISKYSGFAAAGQQPPPVFGEYLAHFAVLEAIYNEKRERPYAPESQEVGYYPRHLDKVVAEGYAKARQEVAEYEKLCDKMMAGFAQRLGPRDGRNV